MPGNMHRSFRCSAICLSFTVCLTGVRPSAVRLSLTPKEAYILLGEDGLPSSVVPRIRGDSGKTDRAVHAVRKHRRRALHVREESERRLTAYTNPPIPINCALLRYSRTISGLTPPRSVAPDGEEFNLNEHAGSREISKVISEAEEKGISEIVSAVMLRSMMKAKYSPKPSPHFGLAAPLYCHFTSPIRRYPDLFVHRSIKAYLNGMPGPSPVRAADALGFQATARSVRRRRKGESRRSTWHFGCGSTSARSSTPPYPVYRASAYSAARKCSARD